MGTKLEPSKYDAWDKAEPTEPRIALIARDPDFEIFLHMWCHWRQRQIAVGMRPDNEEERGQIAEMFMTASEGAIWRREYLLKKEMERLSFDTKGIPTTGQYSVAVADNINVYGVTKP